MNFTDASDEQLLQAFARGDDAALGELAHRYESRLLGLACGLLGRDGALACDAVQEMWVRVIRGAAKFRGESAVKTWLYRITINCCKDLLAERARRKKIGVNEAKDDRPAAAAPDPDADERRRRVHAAVQALPLDIRALVLLCYHNGLPHAAAAEVLRIPIGTLKSRLHAALTELRTRLESEATP